MPTVYRYGRTRIAIALFAACIAAAFALIVWLALPRGNLADVTLYLVMLAVGFALTIGVWINHGRTVTVTESALVQTGPFNAVVSVAWSEIAQVARFERDKRTEIVPAAGSRKIEIGDDIDRFQELHEAIRLRAGERYSATPLRAEGVRGRLIAAIVIPVVFIGVLLFGPHDPLGWLYYGRVAVVVVDPGGAVVPQASLRVFSKRTAHWPELTDLQFVAPGPLELRLPPGGYLLVGKSPAHGSQSSSFKVEARQTHKLQLVLDPEKR